MGVRGLSTYIRNDSSNFKTIQLHDTIVIIDGYNLINSLYMNGTILTQFNGEYLAFDVTIELFLENLRKCNIEPIFVFDGVHENSKLRTVLRRNNDRLVTCTQFQKSARSPPTRDGANDEFRICVQPPLSSNTFISTLDRHGIRHVTTDFEADQLAAALAIYLRAPLISNDSDFFIFAPYWSVADEKSTLAFIPTDLCDFETPITFEGGFCLSAQQFDPKNGRAFSRLSAIQIPLFAVLCGNDYVPPGFFNDKLPGTAPQQPYVRPTGQAASRTAANARNAEKFRRLASWLSGFSADIVEPVERIMSKFPKDGRDQAAGFLYAGLASYYLPLVDVMVLVKYLYGDKEVPPAVTQQIPADAKDLPKEQYGLRAVQVLARGFHHPEPLPDWPESLMTAYRKQRIMPAMCDALFAFGNIMGPVIEDYANREPYHLCSLPLRRLFVGLLLTASQSDSRRLQNLSGPNTAYREYTRVGCNRFESHRIAFNRLSVGPGGAFGFLQEHLLLPPRPPVIPPWLHGLACILFLWSRFDARPETPRLCSSPSALAVCACAIAAQMRLLRNREDKFARAAAVQSFDTLSKHRGIEELQFSVLHGLAQLQSIHYNLATLVALVGALDLEGNEEGVGVEVPPPQMVFPSGKLAHHIAVHLLSLPPDRRLQVVLEGWMPRLLGDVDRTLLSQVTSMFSGLMKFVDQLLDSIPPADFRQYRRQDGVLDGSHLGRSSDSPKRHHTSSEFSQSQASTSAPISRQRVQPSKRKRCAVGEAFGAGRIEDVVTQAMRDAGLEDEL